MVAYADISTNMILSSSGETDLRQENLDNLCDIAVDVLGGLASVQLRNVVEGSDDAGVFQVIIIEPTEIDVFLRSTTNSMEALCCVCSPLIKLGEFIAGARLHLDAIGLEK